MTCEDHQQFNYDNELVSLCTSNTEFMRRLEPNSMCGFSCCCNDCWLREKIKKAGRLFKVEMDCPYPCEKAREE